MHSPNGRRILLQFLTAVKAVGISAAAACTAGRTRNKEGRFRTEKIKCASLNKNFPVESNTFVANTYASRSRREVLHLALLFATERATRFDYTF